MKWHFEILPQEQQDVWASLSPCKKFGFVLYGGTAVALRLGHRYSIDFDFFSASPLDEGTERTMRAAMPFLAESTLLQIEPNTRTFLTATGVKLSFFGGITFGRVGSPCCTPDGMVDLASLEDLLALKLTTILKRVEIKDYLDIAALLETGDVSLHTGLSGAMALYGTEFSPTYSLKAMTYFKEKSLSELDVNVQRVLIKHAANAKLDALTPSPILSNCLGACRIEPVQCV